MTKVVCSNNGCGKPFSELENSITACQYHPGAPVFHEGSKGWSCCPKKVYDFDNFLKIAGCQVGKHHHDDKKPEFSAAPSNKVTGDKLEFKKHPILASNAKDTPPTVEVYGKVPVLQEKLKDATLQPHKPEINKIKESELNDKKDAVISPGTKCKRPSCKVEYVNEKSKEGDCVFHNGEAVFHEGSKGWSCCSRKVLEFEEFLKIEGCQKGLHRFTDDGKEEEVTECRFDWYQTQSQVIVSVFAKKVDKTKTIIKFEKDKLDIKVKFLDGKNGVFKSLLCQEIIPEESKFSVLSTKIELVLKKGNGISWPSLEPCENVTSWTTFGTVGGGGTVGGKEALIATDSPVHLLKK
ncbi:hypothetical protein HDU92_002805 [Lobulomyces angularis]|nr:hypothetical protein HDU92_002805 [Lobulomyces angularis]